MRRKQWSTAARLTVAACALVGTLAIALPAMAASQGGSQGHGRTDKKVHDEKGHKKGKTKKKVRWPDIPRCALGRLHRPLNRLEPNQIAAHEKRYEKGLSGVGASARARAGQAFATGMAAYIYGMPPVLEGLTIAEYPPQTLIGLGYLQTPEQQGVINPNVDTLYSVARIDLSAGPMVVDAPATAGRYSIVQLMDAYTNSFGYIGSGHSRETASRTAIVGPDWNGTLPHGVAEMRAPTNTVWLLGRTLVDGPDDLDAAAGIVSRYALTPLQEWEGGDRRSALMISKPTPKERPVLPEGLDFFDGLGAALADNPPLEDDACAARAFGRFGIGPGTSPSVGADQRVSDALAAAAPAAVKLIDRMVAVNRANSYRHHNGWAFSRRNAGRFGTDFSYRAVVADAGLAANAREQAIYPNTAADSKGRTLRGKHSYVITFRKGQLPPAKAFWSMTLYDADGNLVANPIDRYAIGDRTAGLTESKNGSLKIYVRRQPPARAKRSNWLPAAAGAFRLNLRLYEPKKAALDGRWQPPTVSRVG